MRAIAKGTGPVCLLAVSLGALGCGGAGEDDGPAPLPEWMEEALAHQCELVTTCELPPSMSGGEGMTYQECVDYTRRSTACMQDGLPPACAEAQRDSISCIGTLGCDDYITMFEGEDVGPAADHPCYQEVQDVMTACNDSTTVSVVERCTSD